MYERHKHKISSQYAARIRAVNDAVSRQNGEGWVALSGVDSGVYIQFKLPQTVNLDRLMKRLSARNVMAVTGKQFYLTNWLEREKFLRISISLVKPERIEDGVRVIMEEVRREIGS
jgi:DNA-binding transcriptional MocR family regulator